MSTELIRQTLGLTNLQLWIGPATDKPREHLRMELINSLENSDLSFDVDQIKNLSLRPKLSPGDISLSHCPTHQGFSWTTDPVFIGFDVETTERVTTQVAARVSTEQELNRAPSPAALWVAKEAAFKAASKAYSINVLSDLEIEHWIPISDQGFVTSARCNMGHLKGCIFDLTGCFYSIFNS